MRVMMDTNVISSAILILENKLCKDTDNQPDLSKVFQNNQTPRELWN